MALTSGTKLGPYEIVSPLGAGGMGEVYQAHDTRLERDVAIKVLPANLSSDPFLRQRLEREAKAVSKLAHPHICTLHDIGHQDGVDFLVMELVKGETLEHRLIRGPLPPEQTVRIAAQVADALAKAHKLGVVHRDVKPSNVMLTKSGAKLMDFGLAKQSGPPPLAVAFTEMTAQQSKLTIEGMIVGTFQYMAPEQLEGKDADARTDIFALGALIYEVATGKPAFAGKSQASLIAAILSTEPPPMGALQPMTPPALERVVKICLAKDPDERWQCASDLASELNWIADEVGSQALEPGRVPLRGKTWQLMPWLIAGLLLLLLIGTGAALWKASNGRPGRAMYFHTSVPFSANDLAMSPNGRTLTMVAYSTQVNNYALLVHELGSQRTTPLDGTQGASYPFWSPDGKFIGFFADGKLKKADLSASQVQVLCDAPNGRGGTWNRDGVIVFAPDSLIGLYRVSAMGGFPVEITKLDTARLEQSHRWPVFLPDGKHFLYMAANFTRQTGVNAIFLGSIDSQEKRQIVSTDANAAYAEPGYLVYLRDKTLVAQPFDSEKYVLSGDPHTLSDQVLYFPHVGRAIFSASNGEVLVTQTGKVGSLSQLTWFDRNGKALGTIGTSGSYNNVRLSPDGQRVATDETDSDGWNIDVWIHDLPRGSTTRLTFDPSLDTTPIWSPDGKRILFVSNRNLGFRVYLKNSDGSGSEEEVADLGSNLQVNPWDWSRDGKYMLVRKKSEVWYLAWPDRAPKPLFQAKWTIRNAQLSPDGRWIAYSTNETGNMEVYVSPFPSVNGKWQVSTSGGEEPRWRQDGRELFYVSADGKMTAVAVKTTTAGFEAGSPVALFQTRRRQPISAQDVFSYDVSGDGKKFLIATKVDEANAAPVSVLLNWASQMDK